MAEKFILSSLSSLKGGIIDADDHASSMRYFLVTITVLLLSTNALATPIAHLVLHSRDKP